MPKITPTVKAMEMLRNGDDPAWIRQCTGVSYDQLRMLQDLVANESAEDENPATDSDTPEEEVGLW